MRTSSSARHETVLYSALVLVVSTCYAIVAVLPGGVRERHPAVASMLFGFDQLRPLGWAALILPVLVGLTLLAPWHRVLTPIGKLLDAIEGFSSRTRVLLALAVGTYSFVWFLGLRNQFINPDGAAFSAKFHADVPVRGATVTHDEMLELFVHSRFWHHTSRAFGWSVEYSYQFLSAAAGGLFVMLLLYFARVTVGDRRWVVLVLGVASSGFMQLFFGDVENYTLVTLLTLAYFLAGHLHLEGRVSLVVPSAVLAVAITFHLLAAFLLLSLAYLYVVSLRRRQWLSVVAAGLTLVVIPAAVVVYFHHNGLPFGVIRTSNAFGQAGKLQRFAAPDAVYHGQVTSLVFLLFPPVLCFLPLIAFRRIALTAFNVFLALAALVYVVYVFTWRADLGVYNDWNLYAPAALPLAILFWRNFALARELANKAAIAVALILASAAHSYAWIIRNHF